MAVAAGPAQDLLHVRRHFVLHDDRPGALGHPVVARRAMKLGRKQQHQQTQAGES
jgi:hypothetical protein